MISHIPTLTTKLNRSLISIYLPAKLADVATANATVGLDGERKIVFIAVIDVEEGKCKFKGILPLDKMKPPDKPWRLIIFGQVIRNKGGNEMKTIHRQLTILAFATLLGTAACGPSAARATNTPAPSATPKATDTLPPQTGTIAFSKYTSEAHTERDIYSIKTDGIGLTLLAHDPGKFVEYPAWSPDGTKIAYQSMTGTDKLYVTYDTSTIWIMNADGSDKLQLTQLPRDGMFPTWSPDSKQIAFCGFTDDGWLHLFVMNADGSNIHQLTSGIFNDRPIAWTPDEVILFLRQTPPNEMAEAFAVNADGSGLVQVTKSELLRGFALSPDGKSLAVYKGAAHQIVVYPREAPGNEVLLLDAFFDCDDVKLSWSPDGKAIALAESTLDAWMGPSDLYIVNADGSGFKTVPEAGKVFDPAWRPE